MLQKIKKLFDPIDLTKGNITKVIMTFVVPILLSMLFQQMYSLTDSIIAGQNLNEAEIASINNSIPISSLILNFNIGCTTGFSAILAKHIGAKEKKDIKRCIFIQLFLCSCIAVIMTTASLLLIDPLLSIMNIKPSEINPGMNDIYRYAKEYLTIRLAIGVTTSLFYNFASSALRSNGDSFAPFLFLVISVITNVVLDLIFIIPLKMSVIGAALATVLSQLIATVGSLIYMFLKYQDFRISKDDICFNFKDIFNHLKMGIPIGIQWMMIFVGVIAMTSSIIPFDITSNNTMVSGNPAQVGYGAANKLSGILMAPFSAIDSMTIAFISQNRGAKDEDRIKKGYKQIMLLALLSSILVTGLGFLLMINNCYQHIFLSNSIISKQSIRFGNTYLIIALPFFISHAFLHIGRGAMEGYEKPLLPFLSGLAELFIRVFFCSFLPGMINGAPITSDASFTSYLAICFSDPICWTVAALMTFLPSLFIIYKKNKTIPRS